LTLIKRRARDIRGNGVNIETMVRRRARTFVAKLLLGVVLFTQAAVASATCDMPVRAPAQVFVGQESMPCHEEPARNANLCLADCLSADQSADTPQVVVPAWTGAALFPVVVDDRSGEQFVPLQRLLPRPTAPPRILFQTFLI